MYFIILYLVLLSQCYNLVQGQNEQPIVETNVGTIRGLRSDDGQLDMFMGIPYAVLDDNNPVATSSPHPGFDEVFDAIDDSSICPQIEEFNFTLVGSLDCLHLNIYSPAGANSSNSLPVMVYIYGGGFTIGFAGTFLYGPEYLVRHDVILVTLNYRLGPYGFLCLDIPEVPGNQGFKDQVLAFRWIHDNIGFFGGDINRITIFGNSAGAISAGLHMYSPIEQLYNKVIMQSGNAISNNPVKDADPTTIFKLTDALGYSTNDTAEALAIIAQTEPLTVIQAVANAGLAFGPCVEQTFPGVESFLTEIPLNSKNLRVENISILAGINSVEALALVNSPNLLDSTNLFDTTLRNNFIFDEERHAVMEEVVRRFYIGDEPPNSQVMWETISFSGDQAFVYSTDRSFDMYFDNGAENVYYYMFSYDGGQNFVKIKDNITVSGVAHADEIGYLFKMRFSPEEPTVADQLIIDRITTLWTNFAKYGNPTPETSELLPVYWEPVTKGSPRYYLNIDTELSLGKRPFFQRMAFWDLFYKINGVYEVSYREDSDAETDNDSTSSVYEFIPSKIIIILPILLICVYDF